MQGIISKSYSCPSTIVNPRLKSCVSASLKPATSLSFPLSTTIPCINTKARPLHISAMLNPLVDHKGKLLPNLQGKRGPCFPMASKDKLFDFEPYPKMTEKPKWWWRTLACLPYLMTFYDQHYWIYLHATNNPPPFLENFETLTFPLLSAISQLPNFLLSAYGLIVYFWIVRRKEWPHFLRFHVITGILIGCLVQVIGISSNWFPTWFFPKNSWSALTFIYLVTVLECIRCALFGMYPDVPFVSDAAYPHTDLKFR